MYSAFISYSHTADGRMAPALQKGIMRYALPWYRRSKLDVFRDESSLSINPNLWGNIQNSLSESEYLIYMASSKSANSKWVGKELEYWLEHKAIDKLIIVVTEGEIIWNEDNNSYEESDQSCIHKLLHHAFNHEPFYIDLRSLRTDDDLSLKNSIFNKEVLKISAELNGKSQKEMAGDEVKAQVRVKRLTSVVLMVLLLAFVTTFYFFKDSQRSQQQAEYNEKVADSARGNVSNLLQIALQGRGEQYQDKEVDTIIEILEYERVRPLEELIIPKATRERVGKTNNFDYLLWIDVPSFRTDSIMEVVYKWPINGYRFVRGDEVISRQASTGFAFGYRGINRIPNNVSIDVYLKGGKRINKNFEIRDYLNKLYGLRGRLEYINPK